MAFHDVRLPDEVEKGAQGGPTFSTSVATLASGYEKRNQNWSTARCRYDVGYGIQTKDDFNEVLAFFYARAGQANSFRFKDWSDFELGEDATDTPALIGIGDGLELTFQIIKRYTSGSQTYTRNITRPVSGTVRVFVNGVEQTVTVDYTVNYSTGVITFTSAPGFGLSVGVICEFDVPVRFSTDQFGITLETWEAGEIPNLPLIEVLGE